MSMKIRSPFDRLHKTGLPQSTEKKKNVNNFCNKIF
jgi:hypothetical protein